MSRLAIVANYRHRRRQEETSVTDYHQGGGTEQPKRVRQEAYKSEKKMVELYKRPQRIIETMCSGW